MTRVRIALVMNECGQWAAYGDSDDADRIELAMDLLDNISRVSGGTIVQRWIEADVPSLPVIEGEVTA